MTTGDPLPPADEARIRNSFSQQGLMTHLGADMFRLEKGLAVIRQPYRPELLQHHGYFHAGASSAIADTAGGYAAMTMFPADRSVLTVEFKLNLINPARGDWLEAHGRVVRPGRTLTVCQLDVWASREGDRQHVATGLQTLICVSTEPRG